MNEELQLALGNGLTLGCSLMIVGLIFIIVFDAIDMIGEYFIKKERDNYRFKRTAMFKKGRKIYQVASIYQDDSNYNRSGTYYLFKRTWLGRFKKLDVTPCPYKEIRKAYKFYSARV